MVGVCDVPVVSSVCDSAGEAAASLVTAPFDWLAQAMGNLYFIRCQLPRVVDNDGQITHRVRERFMPITSPVQTDLIRLVREELRPKLPMSDPPASAHTSRLELTQAITHRPQPRAEGLGL